MGGITSDEYEMELATLVEQARRLGVQADMLAAKAGDDMSEDVADMLGAALGDGDQSGGHAEQVPAGAGVPGAGGCCRAGEGHDVVA